MTPNYRRSVVRKAMWRLLPLVFLLYIVAYLDRANLGFAKLRMQPDLGFSDAVFGWGIGIFFVGYLLLEIPGAILVERWSARKWFTRILLSWGVCSMAMAFVETSTQFYVTRFLLGLSEAGFFPGVIVYLTHWFPKQDRTRALAGLILAVPLSLALGARISAWLMEQSVPNLSGWQLVFLVEGAPAVILGFIVPFVMTDRPRDAKWLTTDERDWLESTLQQERKELEAIGKLKLSEVLSCRPVWLLALAIFATNTGGITLGFWLPTAIKNILTELGREATDSVALNWIGIIYLCAFVGVLCSGQSSDRLQERKWHCAVGMTMSGVFLGLSLIPGLPWQLRFGLMCVMGFFVVSWAPPFWALPQLVLPPAAVAVAIGFINMWANVAGALGSPIVGAMKDAGLTDQHCMIFLTGCYLAGGVIIANLPVPRRPAVARPESPQS